MSQAGSYEEERAANVARNDRKLAELGVQQAKQRLDDGAVQRVSIIPPAPQKNYTFG